MTAPRYYRRPSQLLADLWMVARDAAYDAGHGAEFDRITTEIEVMQSAARAAGTDESPGHLAATYALAQQRRALIHKPSSPASSAA